MSTEEIRNEQPRSKVEEYVRLLRNHVLHPIQTGVVEGSCFATILMVFSAVDGLGQLFHPEHNVPKNKGFKWFLKHFGSTYVERETELWKLRNSLVHNALNVLSFVSHVPAFSREHLRTTSDGMLLISTHQLAKDFADAIESLVEEMDSDIALKNRAESRLQWIDVEIPQFSPTTPPPPIRFRCVSAKSR